MRWKCSTVEAAFLAPDRLRADTTYSCKRAAGGVRQCRHAGRPRADVHGTSLWPHYRSLKQKSVDVMVAQVLTSN